MTLINNPDLFSCSNCGNFLHDGGKSSKGYCLHKSEVMNRRDLCDDWEATESEKAGIDFWALPIAPENKRNGNSGGPQ